MKTVRMNLYEYHELSPESQDRAAEQFANSTTDYAWWEYVCDMADSNDVKITEFDLDHGFIKGSLKTDVFTICRDMVKHCERSMALYKLARGTIRDLWSSRREWIAAAVDDADEYFEESREYDDIETEFTREVLEEYLIILRKEYDYLTSRECIASMISGNGYLFTENGEHFEV